MVHSNAEIAARKTSQALVKISSEQKKVIVTAMCGDVADFIRTQ
ncbi:hypothetical protein PF010_g10340 [Phytophthora fragariae]|uniref:Uncharacterized protein n=1 Tax=Phytophthora fragariae TaxID=53985 RepID=A0A6A4DKG4_9STRA|nr:hypothetical protein PF003_g17886 [Phytophthora fragariae]KAE9112721.1 hypothetical protein PF010_g10340 [Phytophthora fragariae]KAE9113025.1 hypothetical protein PF007_g10873 [Phytophthora fragariae]KAE9310033.1 hypothetical protein PF001_g10393 [Phytophthora fragariae]